MYNEYFKKRVEVLSGNIRSKIEIFQKNKIEKNLGISTFFKFRTRVRDHLALKISKKR